MRAGYHTEQSRRPWNEAGLAPGGQSGREHSLKTPPGHRDLRLKKSFDKASQPASERQRHDLVLLITALVNAETSDPRTRKFLLDLRRQALAARNSKEFDQLLAKLRQQILNLEDFIKIVFAYQPAQGAIVAVVVKEAQEAAASQDSTWFQRLIAALPAMGELRELSPQLLYVLVSLLFLIFLSVGCTSPAPAAPLPTETPRPPTSTPVSTKIPEPTAARETATAIASPTAAATTTAIASPTAEKKETPLALATVSPTPELATGGTYIIDANFLKNAFRLQPIIYFELVDRLIETKQIKIQTSGPLAFIETTNQELLEESYEVGSIVVIQAKATGVSTPADFGFAVIQPSDGPVTRLEADPETGFVFGYSGDELQVIWYATPNVPDLSLYQPAKRAQRMIFQSGDKLPTPTPPATATSELPTKIPEPATNTPVPPAKTPTAEPTPEPVPTATEVPAATEGFTPYSGEFAYLTNSGVQIEGGKFDAGQIYLIEGGADPIAEAFLYAVAIQQGRVEALNAEEMKQDTPEAEQTRLAALTAFKEEVRANGGKLTFRAFKSSGVNSNVSLLEPIEVTADLNQPIVFYYAPEANAAGRVPAWAYVGVDAKHPDFGYHFWGFHVTETGQVIFVLNGVKAEYNVNNDNSPTIHMADALQTLILLSNLNQIQSEGESSSLSIADRIAFISSSLATGGAPDVRAKGQDLIARIIVQFKINGQSIVQVKN